ncbi:hypothetical protein OK015_20505 [Mycobacterium sp. Aquia_216]|uniref:hypothetical protein n=1 Tax=Mycobacterium sp. Aquia_216 TaxID=2991729 RepID=UPI00227B84DB|nr:hypothetical protein [Mycobacterium sp. Aquia_216]WAJ43562.1 hypothetical protein OK015_20505 [Mycobacterium sp. Aquia_216]
MATDDHPVDQELPAGHVAWAGLPINLDYAFSQAQRDKVYAQHLIRKRWCSLRAHSNDGDGAAVDPDTGQIHVEWLSDDRRHAG